MTLGTTPSVMCHVASCASCGSCELHLLDSTSCKDKEESKVLLQFLQDQKYGCTTLSLLLQYTLAWQCSVFLSVLVCLPSPLYKATVEGYLVSISDVFQCQCCARQDTRTGHPDCSWPSAILSSIQTLGLFKCMFIVLLVYLLVHTGEEFVQWLYYALTCDSKPRQPEVSNLIPLCLHGNNIVGGFLVLYVMSVIASLVGSSCTCQ